MRLVIDTDPGIDDALALLLALGTPAVRVEAITTVAGNVDLERVTANARRILGVARPSAMPRLARGAAEPLAGPSVLADDFHADDGLGGLHGHVDTDGQVRYPDYPVVLEMRDGADVILEEAHRHGRELTVIALGPLTNLALALRRDPEALAGVGRIVVMGGAVGVPGNVTPAAEFNFFVDPEAAAEVFRARLPLELVPLDVTHRVRLADRDLEGRMGPPASRVARFVGDVTRHSLEFARASGDRGIALHDPLAVGVALDPTLVSFEDLHVEVECEGRHTRGMSLADRRPRRAGRGKPPNCRVATGVDAPRFLRMFLERLCPASS